MKRFRGFSLIEMAVALFVITLLLGSILVPLQTQVERSKYDETRRILEQAREALLGYVAANGYFPCPADGASNGQEAAGFDHSASGSCPNSGSNNTYHGFLPAATLGFTPTDANGYAIDGWALTQNRIRYAVSSRQIGGVNRMFVSQNGMSTAGMATILNDTNLLKVCSSGIGASGTNCGGGAVEIARNVPVVIWSLGPNAATSGGSAPHEDKNLIQNRVFVTRERSNVAGAEYDDIVVWISLPVLFNRLIVAGQLP